MIPFDSQCYPYPSQRRLVFAQRGMVATSQLLAAEAGLEILREGGNAIDAAITTAACLTVVEPTSCGIGGDAFALVWTNGKIYGLNSSGPAPKAISGEEMRKKGFKKIPDTGWYPITVPGAPAAWVELSRKFGRLTLIQSLTPAIEYAQNGFPVSPVVSYLWGKAFDRYNKLKNMEELKYWFDTFVPMGRVPKPGEIWKIPEQACTLKEIAESEANSFYSGDIADTIDLFSRKYGGYLRKEDLVSFCPEWVEPVCINYKGYDVWEIPPNGQGLVALMTLNILKEMPLAGREFPDTFHYIIEAMKLAFTDGKTFITDSRQMKESVERLLSSEYAAQRRSLIAEKALNPHFGKPSGNNTVYLATADSEGNMVSYIQSNYMGFGSGIVIPGTGIALHNRGHGFSLDPEHINYLEPGKKTYHTIIPGFLTKDGEAVGPFGVMGGYMQPQGHVQVVTNIIDFGLNPQAALDAPRWQWTGGKQIKLEDSFPQHITEKLKKMGHIIEVDYDSSGFGRGQIIWRNKNGVLIGATEPRCDGTVAAW